MSENLFLKLLNTGNIKFEDGLFIIWNAHNIVFPVRCILKLQELLIGKFGKQGEEIIREVSYYQIEQAIKRYSKIFQIEKKSSIKIVELGLNIAELLGMGKYKILSFDEKTHRLVIISENVPMPREYKIIYGKSEKPIDMYLCFILEAFFSKVFDMKMKCVETKCLAMDDPVCQFELMPL